MEAGSDINPDIINHTSYYDSNVGALAWTSRANALSSSSSSSKLTKQLSSSTNRRSITFGDGSYYGSSRRRSGESKRTKKGSESNNNSSIDASSHADRIEMGAVPSDNENIIDREPALAVIVAHSSTLSSIKHSSAAATFDPTSPIKLTASCSNADQKISRSRSCNLSHNGEFNLDDNHISGDMIINRNCGLSKSVRYPEMAADFVLPDHDGNQDLEAWLKTKIHRVMAALHNKVNKSIEKMKLIHSASMSSLTDKYGLITLGFKEKTAKLKGAVLQRWFCGSTSKLAKGKRDNKTEMNVISKNDNLREPISADQRNDKLRLADLREPISADQRKDKLRLAAGGHDPISTPHKFNHVISQKTPPSNHNLRVILSPPKRHRVIDWKISALRGDDELSNYTGYYQSESAMPLHKSINSMRGVINRRHNHGISAGMRLNVEKVKLNHDTEVLNQFFRQQRRKLESFDGGEDKRFHILLSRPESGLSSMISTICYAWIIEHFGDVSEWITLPVINTTRHGLWNNKQAIWFFQQLGIDMQALVFSDEVKLEDLTKTTNYKISTFCEDILHMNKEHVASCCTILVERYFTQLETKFHLRCIETLLLAGLILDRKNMDDKLVSFRRRDKAAFNTLITRSPYNDARY